MTDRVSLAVAITIQGKGSNGRAFVESAQTIEITGRGARIATAQELVLGSEITVQNLLGQTAAAKVLWRGEAGAPPGSHEFGIVLLTPSAAEGLWRIDSPPQGQPQSSPPGSHPLSLDRVDEKQAANGSAAPAAPTEGSGSALAPATSELPPDTVEKPDPNPPEKNSAVFQSLPGPSSADRPSVTLEEQVRPAEQAPRGQPGQSGLNWLAEPGDGQHLEPVLQTSEATATPIEPSTEARPNSLETQAPFRAVDVDSASKSIEFFVDEALARLQAARGTAESELMVRIEEYEQRLNSLASRAIAVVEEESKTLAASLTAGLVDETSGRISRAAQAASESLAQESKSISESQASAALALKEQAETAARTAVEATASLAATRQQAEAALEARAAEVSAALKSIDSSSAEAVSRLRADQEAMEASLTAKIEETERRLSGLASSAIAAIEERSETLGESLRERALSLGRETLQQSSDELLKQKASAVQTAGEELLTLRAGLIDEASSRISHTAQAASESLAQASKRIAESQASAALTLKEQAETAARTAVEATASLAATRQQTEAALEARVAEVSAALKSIDSPAAEAVSRLRAAQEAMEASLTAKIEETERRLTGVASSAIAAIEARSETLSESLKERALSLGRETLQQSSDELLKQKANAVQTAGEELLTLRAGLIDEASSRISHAAQAASESLAQASKRISKSQAHAALGLKEQAETVARTAVEASASLAATRQQTEATLEARVAEVSAALKPIDSCAAEAVSRLRAAQEAMEASLTAKIEETERRLTGVASSAIAVIEERSETLSESLKERALSLGRETLQQSSDELLKQKANAVQTAGEELLILRAGLIDEASSRISHAAQVASESLARESKRISESQARAALALKEQPGATSGTAPDATASLAATREMEASLEARLTEASGILQSIDSSAEEAVSRLRAAREAMESSLLAKIDEAEQRLSGLASRAIAVIDEKSGTLGQSLSERLQMLDRSSAELLKQKASIVQTAGEELLNLTVGLVEKASGQVERAAQAASESLAQESKRISESQAQESLRELTAQRAEAMRATGESLRSLKAEIEDETANQIARAAEGALASLSRDSQRILEECKNRGSQILSEQAQTLAGSAEAAISGLNAAQERSTAAFHTRITENERCLTDQLNATIETLNRNQEALLKRSHGQTERDLALLRQEATEAVQRQMRGDADCALRDCARQIQQQTEEAKHARSLELATSGAEFKEQVKKELSDLTRAALASLTEEIRAVVTEQVDDLRRRLVAIGEQSSQALEETQGQWAAKQSAIIRENLGLPQSGAFRNVLSQLSSALTTRARTVVRRLRLPIAVVGIIAVVGGIAFSVRPVRRLKTTPPDPFFDEYYRVAEGGSLHAEEQKLARAYWECALKEVQPRFSSNADLPESPPPEFKVDVNQLALGGFKEDGDTRIGYWLRLRALWASPDTWNKSYEWNTDWTRRLLSFGRADHSH